MKTTRPHYDAKLNYFPHTSHFTADEGQGYSIPELPLPNHRFKLDATEVFFVQRKPYFSPPAYGRVSSAPFSQHSEPKQDMPPHDMPLFPVKNPARKVFSQTPNTPQENQNSHGHFDSFDKGDIAPEGTGGNYFDQGQAIPKECYQLFSNQIPAELTCIISTHLANGHDVNSISNVSRNLLDFMRPFHNSIRLTDEIIFGRRLSDVHVLMKEPHVSGQQFILKFRIQSDRYHMIIHNHGNQIIKLSGTSGVYELERGISYAFDSGDDFWLTINGIEEVMWRIQVNGTINDTEMLPYVSLENSYFNTYVFQNSLQPMEYAPPMPIPGESHN